MLNLILETTTGRLIPAGTAPQIPRGPEPVTLQLVTNGNAALLPDGQPLALKLYDPADQVTPVYTLNAWATNASFLLYQATLDVRAALGYSPLQVLLGRISYGEPNVDSPFFHALLGGIGAGAGAVPQIVITQPTGPTNYVQALGQFGGKAILNQVEGFHRVKSVGSLLGLQLNCQDAPTGADLLVEVIKNTVATGKVATLAAAAKFQETIFGAPLALAIGDVIQFKPTQIGSIKPGTNLSVGGIVTLQ